MPGQHNANAGGNQIGRNSVIEIPVAWLERFSTDFDDQELRVALAMVRLASRISSTEIRVATTSLQSDQLLTEGLKSNPSNDLLGQILDQLRQSGLLTFVDEGETIILHRSASSEPTDSASLPAASDKTSGNPWVYRLHEQHFGPLTPLIADQIQMAIETYPESWIRDAMRDAVTYNRRSWRYVQRILANWADRDTSERTRQSPHHEKRRRGAEGTIDTRRYREGGHLKRARKLPM